MSNDAEPTRLSTTVYLHASRESMYDKGRELGLADEVLRHFSFACYEVKVGLVVDPKTGDAIIATVDGRTVLHA